MAVREKIAVISRPFSAEVERVLDSSVKLTEDECQRCAKKRKVVTIPCCKHHCFYCPNCLVKLALSEAYAGCTILYCKSCVVEWNLGQIMKYGGALEEEIDKISSKLTSNLKIHDGFVDCPVCHTPCLRSNGYSKARVRCESCSKGFCWVCKEVWRSAGSSSCGNSDCTGEGTPLQVGSTTLGKGAYGLVSLGEKNGREVAAKAWHKLLVEAAAVRKVDMKVLIEMFKAEASLMKSLEHSNLVTCYGLEKVGDEIYLMMEKMKESLHAYVDSVNEESRQPVSELSAVSVGRQVSAGLQFLHGLEEQVVHRDLSSKNILIGYDFVVKIADFGMAKCRPSDLEYLQTKSPGNVHYMPPEALQDEPKYTEKLDIFSLGVDLLEVETMMHPQPMLIGIGTNEETYRRRKHLARVGGNNPIKRIIIACLDNDHHLRPSAKEVHSQLCRL